MYIVVTKTMYVPRNTAEMPEFDFFRIAVRIITH